jgi:hypothetical protein
VDRRARYGGVPRDWKTRFGPPLSYILVELISRPAAAPRVREDEVSPAQPEALSVVVRRRPVLVAIVAVWLPLAALSLGGQLYLYVLGGTDARIPRRLNVDSELTVWSWFQSTLLFVCAALLAVAAFAAYRTRTRYARHWSVLSLCLLWVSIDEAASIHELTIGPLHDALNTSGIFYFAWVIPAIPIVLALALFYAKFLGHLEPGVRALFICAGAAYVIGALGGDLVGGQWQAAHGNHNLTYALMTQVEENLETAGITLGILAVLTHLGRAVPRWLVRLDT